MGERYDGCGYVSEDRLSRAAGLNVIDEDVEERGEFASRQRLKADAVKGTLDALDQSHRLSVPGDSLIHKAESIALAGVRERRGRGHR